MVLKSTKNMRTGKARASEERKKGFNATVFKTKGGKVKVSVSRPGKNKR